MVFSFTYQTYPTQCQNLTINWTGGSAPYHILLVPIGDAETVTKKPENRKIVDVVINDASQSSYTFKLQFPGGTQFVPTIYDKNGIQAGATGVPTTVAAADDASCLFGPTKTKFDFYLTPGNILTQCASTKITWTGSPTPPLTFYGLIPGGESFQIPVPSGATTEFDWTANVRQGSSVLIVAGDSTGIGLGGSALFNVNSGGTSCLNNNSPSSTLGSPAGAVTGTPGGGNGGSAGGGSTGGGSSTGGGGRYRPFVLLNPLACC